MGEKVCLRTKESLKAKDFVRGNLCDVGFFNSLNHPVHVIASRLRFLLDVNGCGGARAAEAALRWQPKITTLLNYDNRSTHRRHS